MDLLDLLHILITEVHAKYHIWTRIRITAALITCGQSVYAPDAAASQQNIYA